MIEPGLFQHYKGAFYRVLFVAKDSDNGSNNDRDVVVYVSLSEPGRISTRHLEEFDQVLPDENKRRFQRVGD